MKTRRRILRSAAVLACALASILLIVHCEKLVPRQSWNQKWGPMVPHESFPGDCGICHTPDQWDHLRTDFSFDHESETGVPLEGAHQSAACLRCHNDRGPVAAYVARGCGGCHVDPHKSALGLDCERCHTQEFWEPTGLIADHARTRFPLVAVHAITPCETCHERATVGDFVGAPVECHLCHQQDALRASPPHPINGWTRDCVRCHLTPANWTAGGFNHDFFPLLGGHAGLDCTQCHPSGQFTPLSPQCFACHQDDYTAAPNHVADNFPTDCLQCHNTNAWEDTD